MWSRRQFLSLAAAGFAVPAGARAWLEAQEEIKTVLNGPVGLQMWSLREYLPKDLPGTLAKVRAMGFRDVEGAGLWKHPVGELRAALDSAGLRCQSAHMGFERVRDDAAGAIAEAKALGASWVVCPWISHDKVFTREDALKSAEVFNKFAAAAEAAGLRFAYHCHGYEMLPSPEGHPLRHAGAEHRSQTRDVSGRCLSRPARRHRSGGPHQPLRRTSYEPALEGPQEGGRHHERHGDGHSGPGRAARHGTGGLARGPSRRDEGRRVTLRISRTRAPTPGATSRRACST